MIEVSICDHINFSCDLMIVQCTCKSLATKPVT